MKRGLNRAVNRAVWSTAAACVALAGFGVVARAQMTAAVRQIVEAERAFSAASVAKTTRDAFMEYLADDSLLFRPGPVPGKMFIRNRPSPPGKLVWAPTFADAASSEDIGYTSGPYEFRKAEMTETPQSWGHYVAIWRKQRDGAWKVEVQLGVSHEKFSTAVADVKDVATPPAATSGADSAKPVAAGAEAKTATPPASGKPANPPAAGAAAPTQKPGTGRGATAGAAAAGAGTANPPAAGATPNANSAKPPASGAAPASGATPGANSAKPPATGAAAGSASSATPPANPPAAGAGATPAPAAPLSPAKQAEEALKEVDRAFAKAVADQGAVKAFAATASPHIRMYRAGSLPIVGKAAVEAMQATALGSSWQPAHARVAASGDFGYTTGMISMGAAPTPGSQGQPQYYVRVWRKDKSGAWKVELDIVN
jgi:ketosteroid isomerase-like protein